MIGKRFQNVSGKTIQVPNRISDDFSWSPGERIDILEVTRRSSQAEIKKSFYRLAMKWHPDKNPGNIEQATKMMQKLNASYSLLMR